MAGSYEVSISGRPWRLRPCFWLDSVEMTALRIVFDHVLSRAAGKREENRRARLQLAGLREGEASENRSFYCNYLSEVLHLEYEVG